MGTRTSAAYFLGVISAGKYREISRPAGTWHMVGLVQLFFIRSSCCTGPNGADPIVVRHCKAPLRNGSSTLRKWTNETRGAENWRFKIIK
jgi:hypothetical protein